MKRFFSFDIFDTCITRDCGSEKGVIYLLASAIMPGASETCKRDFVLSRLEAERVAGLHNEAPTITQIYQYFQTSLFTHFDKVEIQEMEMEIEKKSWAPVLKIKEKLDACRRLGGVIFISDMYLPGSFMLPKLKELGIIKDGEHLYVSCDYNKTKHTGRLFKVVAEKENIKYKDWTHYGDNYINDIEVPSSLGITSKFVETPFSSYEKMWYDKGCLYSNSTLKLYAGITRSVRNEYFQSDHDEITTNLLASSFVPTALRFVSDIKKKGIKKIFFAARDCYYMFVAAKKIFEHDKDLDIEYLHISTKVLYPLLIKEGSREELLSMLSLLPIFKPSSILKMIGVGDEEKRKIDKIIDTDEVIDNDQNKVDTFVDAILKNVDSEQIANVCAGKRERFMKYARQIGLLTVNDEKVALIDLGWRGTSQYVLHELGFKNVEYWYLGMMQDRLPVYKMGDSSTYNYVFEDTSDILMYSMIMEYYLCTTDQGSTIDYSLKNGIIEPVYANNKLPKEEKERVNLSATVVKEISKRLGKYISLKNEHGEMLFDVCTMETLKSFISQPPRYMLKQMRPFAVQVHYGRTVRYIGELFIGDYLYYFFYLVATHLHVRLKRPKYLEFGWTKGTNVLSLGKKEKYIENLYFKLAPCVHKMVRWLKIIQRRTFKG